MGKINRAIDLFCGCGGISVGLRSAGFQVIAGVDIEPTYLCSFSKNFPESHSLLLDIAEVNPIDFMDMVGLRSGDLDILAGGPPCQGFSKNVPRKQRYLEDPRNKLVKTFLDYCTALQPRFILMENVAEMKNGFEQSYTQEILNRLNGEGYTVTYEVLNAANFGVPQRRRRAFFIANRLGFEFKFPESTHIKDSPKISLFSQPKHITVWEAIGDLAALNHGEGATQCVYACEPFSNFQRLMRGDSRIVKNHLARRLQPIQHERLSSLKPGEGLKDLPPHLQTKGGYSGAYGRLTKDMIAPTITRWVFHPGSGRWGHPVDIRTLTIREIARLQSFPDSFEFVGTFTQQAGQLGNAVPPLLIQKIAESIPNQSVSFNLVNTSISVSKSIFSSNDGSEKAAV